VGHALIWRAVALGAAGAALLIALVRPGARRVGFLVVGLATLAAIVVHVANGHAATSKWSSAITVTAQSAHFAAAGIWIGGLAALLLGLRADAARDRAGAARDRSGAVRRFAVVAAIGLIVVTATGILRTFSELRAFDELWSTGYGRAILVKLGLIAMIAGLAWPTFAAAFRGRRGRTSRRCGAPRSPSSRWPRWRSPSPRCSARWPRPWRAARAA
jgi:copper transport protein